MAHNFQFGSTSSCFRRSISMPRLPDWANPFPHPNRWETSIVVESENCKFTIERGVTRVETTVVSTINVEYTKTRVLMGKVFGKPEKVDVIHRELALSWTKGVKNTLLVDHFDRNWFALEFIDKDEMKYVLYGRPWYVTGKIFHFERWMEDFRESNPITFLRVWVQIPQIPLQFKEVEIMKNNTQPIDRLVKLDDASSNSLNANAIKVLIDMDVRLPLKRVFVVNGDEKLPTFISYENLFEVCFYSGRRKVENCGCDEEDKDVSWFMVNKVVMIPTGC